MDNSICYFLSVVDEKVSFLILFSFRISVGRRLWEFFFHMYSRKKKSQILDLIIYLLQFYLLSRKKVDLRLLLFSCSVVSDSLRPHDTPWTVACQASLSFTISWSLLKLMPTESVMPSNHLILCRPLLLPSIFLSIRVFSNDSALCIRWSN